MAKYVVKIEHRENTGGLGVTYSGKYLVYAAYDPYNHRLGYGTSFLSPDQTEAFKFRERAAAEVMAATYGGKVVRLTPKA